MAKLSSWLANPKTKAIVTGFASCPKFVISTDPIPAIELQTVKDEELAQGWPLPIVTTCHSRRVRAQKVWIGDNGVSLGDRPSPYIIEAGKDSSWMFNLLDVKYPLSPLVALRQSNGYMTPSANSWIYEPGNAERTAQMLIDMLKIDLTFVDATTVDNASGVSNYGYSGNAAVGADQISTRSENGKYFVVGIAYGEGYGEAYTASGHLRSYVVFVRFLARSDMTGLHGVYYQHGYAQSWFQNYGGDPSYPDGLKRAGENIYPFILVASADWAAMLQPFAPGLSYTTNTTCSYYHSNGKLTYTCYLRDVAQVAVPPTLYDAPTTWSKGPANVGLYQYNVSHIGDPEFADRVHFVGPVSMLPSGDIEVDAKEVYLRWAGERLIEMSPNMADADRAQLRGKIINTRIAETWDGGTLRLQDLGMWGDAEEAELDLADEIFMPARDGNAAVKFSDALNRANLADKRIFHQMIGLNGMQVDDITHIKMTGTSIGGGTIVAATMSGDITVSTNTDDAMFYVAEGYPIDLQASSLSDPYVDCFGLTLAEIRSNKYRAEKKHHFNEFRMFPSELPDTSRVSRAVLTAQMLVQHCLNRKQMSSFVIGALTMATVARRKLL